jgi:hypothetical protein
VLLLPAVAEAVTVADPADVLKTVTLVWLLLSVVLLLAESVPRVVDHDTATPLPTRFPFASSTVAVNVISVPFAVAVVALGVRITTCAVEVSAVKVVAALALPATADAVTVAVPDFRLVSVTVVSLLLSVVLLDADNVPNVVAHVTETPLPTRFPFASSTSAVKVTLVLDFATMLDVLAVTCTT